MTTKRNALLIATALLAGCEGGGLPASLGPANKDEGDGPVVKFDLFAKPLPEVPLPNDVATRPDPNSPTGRRINASMIAETRMESSAREKIDTLDGWGVVMDSHTVQTHPQCPDQPFQVVVGTHSFPPDLG